MSRSSFAEGCDTCKGELTEIKEPPLDCGGILQQQLDVSANRITPAIEGSPNGKSLTSLQDVADNVIGESINLEDDTLCKKPCEVSL